MRSGGNLRPCVHASSGDNFDARSRGRGRPSQPVAPARSWRPIAIRNGLTPSQLIAAHAVRVQLLSGQRGRQFAGAVRRCVTGEKSDNSLFGFRCSRAPVAPLTQRAASTSLPQTREKEHKLCLSLLLHPVAGYRSLTKPASAFVGGSRSDRWLPSRTVRSWRVRGRRPNWQRPSQLRQMQ